MKETRININLTVDWEGEHLEDLQDFLQVRESIGNEKPFTHFICPLYFLQHGKRIIQKMKSAIFPHDEVALHVHCYRPLVEKAGVKFRTEHDYYLTKKNPGRIDKLLKRFKTVSGRGVPLSVYTYDEIEKIIGYAAQLLRENLTLDKLSGFRAGGWIANNAVFEVLEKLDFAYDSSVVPPEVLSKEYSENSRGTDLDDYNENYGIFNRYVSELWGTKIIEQGFLSNSRNKQFSHGVPDYSAQPYQLGKLMEFPNNFGMSDFTDPEKSVKRFLSKKSLLPDTFTANYGCHMEGDKFYKQKIINFCALFPNAEYSTIGK